MQGRSCEDAGKELWGCREQSDEMSFCMFQQRKVLEEL